MSTDKRIKKYLENMPYGKDSLSSEIHGRYNQRTINHVITSLANKVDEHMASGDKASAKYFGDAIKQIARDMDLFKGEQEELAMYLSSDVMSNYTDTRWDIEWLTENTELSFNEELRPVFSVIMPNGEKVTKGLAEIPENWVVRGSEEAQFMQMQQDAVKQRNTVGQPIDYDIDWAVSKLLKSNDTWKSAVTDDWGGSYFLHAYLEENEEAFVNGEIPDEMLHPDSFNPEFDNRLQTHYTNRLKKSFDPDYQTPKEAQEADELMAKTNNENTQV